MNVDMDMLKQLSLSSDLTGADADLLKRVLAGISTGNKVKMTPQERNRLMSKLSNQNSNEYVATKDVEEMNEEERKAHREALRKKLRDRQRAAEQARAGKHGGGMQTKKSVNNAVSSIQDILSKLDMNQINAHAEQVARNSVENNQTNNLVQNQTETKPDENLDDYVN